MGTCQCLLAVSSCVFGRFQCAAGNVSAPMARPDCFTGRHVELSSSYHLTLSDYSLLLFNFRCRVEQNIGLDQLCPFAVRRASDTHTGESIAIPAPPQATAVACIAYMWRRRRLPDGSPQKPLNLLTCGHRCPARAPLHPYLRLGALARLPHTTWCWPAV